MSETQWRFLVRRDGNPQPLASFCQNKLVHLITSIPRIKTSTARNWILQNVSPRIRESLLERFTDDFVSGQCSASVYQKSWALLYNHQNTSLIVPSEIIKDEKTMKNVFAYLGSGFRTSTPTIIFKVIVIPPPEAVHYITNFISHSPNLADIQIRKVATDEMLKVIGEKDEDKENMNLQSDSNISECDKENSCDQTNIKDDTHENLHSMDNVKVDDKFVSKLRNPLPLKYLDFSSCFTLFCDNLHILSHLTEIRIGADVPPEYKDKTRKFGVESKVVKGELEKALPKLLNLQLLRNLILKDVTNDQVRIALEVVGKRLTRLDLHFMSFGFDLGLLVDLARNLEDLEIADSLIYPPVQPCRCSLCWRGPSRTKSQGLIRLRHLSLNRVQYKPGADTYLLDHSHSLLSLHQEAGPDITDEYISKIGDKLSDVEQIVIKGLNCQLTYTSVLNLISIPSLERLGDLQDWNLTTEERNILSKRKDWIKKVGYSNNLTWDT